jgi:hypothetical protein
MVFMLSYSLVGVFLTGLRLRTLGRLVSLLHQRPDGLVVRDLEQLVIPDASNFTYPAWPPVFMIDVIHNYGNQFDPVLIAPSMVAYNDLD